MISDNDLNTIKQLQPFYFKNILPDLVTWQEIEQVVNFRPVVNNKRFHILSDEDYSWPANGWLTDYNTYPADIINSEIKKHVCYIQDCSRINKKINNVCEQLEKTLKIPADAHIFFSLKETENKKGFGKHNDTQHNLIVCVDGSFNMKVYGDEIIEKTMNNGDAMFVPKEVDHEIIPMSKRLSVSFPMAPHHHFFQTREWVNL